MDEVDPRARLEALARAGGHDLSALSRLIGRNAAYVQQFVRRGSPRQLAEADRRVLAEFLGVDEHELGGTAGGARALPAEAPGPRPPGGVLLVARLDVGAAAGAGSFADEETGHGRVPFAASWVGEVARGGGRELSVIRVAGDSMLPTLADGDEILVDRADAAAGLRDGVYVLRLDDALVVKRVQPGRPGRVSVRSDNPLFASRDDVALAEVGIVGRVLWLGRRL